MSQCVTYSRDVNSLENKMYLQTGLIDMIQLDRYLYGNILLLLLCRCTY